MAIVLAAYYFTPSRTIHSNFITKLIDSKGASSRMNTLDYNPSNLLLAVGYENGEINVYDTSKELFSTNIQAHEYRVSHLASSRNGRLLSSGSTFEDVTKIWDMSNSKHVISIPKTRGPEIFSSDGNTIYMADTSHIKIYNLLDTRFFPAEYQTNGVVESLALSSDDKYIAVGTTGKIQVWEIKVQHEGISFWKRALGHKNISLELISQKSLYKPKDWIKLVKFANDNKKIVTVSRFGNVDIFESPFLTDRVNSTSQLKHITSANYLDKEGAVYLTGTKDSSGLGEGFVESVSLRSSPPIVLINGLSNVSTSTIILPAEVVLISNSRKFLALSFKGNIARPSNGSNR